MKMDYFTSIFNYLKCCDTRPSTKKINLLLLGLENSGKTTVAKGLAHELENGVVPTVGFSSVTLSFKKFSVVLYDLGGGPGIRAIWHKYFVDAHGIIFVLDSSDVDKVTECRGILENLLSNEKLSGKPLLVLGNKQDVDGALDEIDIVELLHLEDLVNQQKCPTLVETCSALSLKKSTFKDDQVIQNSFKWLLSLIESDYDELNDRVERDMLLQREIDETELKRKIKRVMEARKLNKESAIVDNENGDQVCVLEDYEINKKGNHFDPFQPIGDLLNGRVERGEHGDDGKVSDDQSVQVLPESRVKRLCRQDGLSGELTNNRRTYLNCFWNNSNASNVSRSPKKSSARRFGLWRSNKTVPLEPSDGTVWAVTLPPDERVELYEAALSRPFPLPPLTETTFKAGND